MRSLDEYLPTSTRVGSSPHCLTNVRPLTFYPQLGVAASSTPFVTGRPHTLIYGDQVFSNGAVGIAILRRSQSNQTQNLSIRYDRLETLGEPTEVTM